ncbi:MAG: hypothetical protein Q8S73_33260 [Deltaproteobacteria bacterium]|nr:hypothetical protein [Myxococcales bacterium]MDP3219016.1 hypothetical protein [Deltaproteobacteria bacterium]
MRSALSRTVARAARLVLLGLAAAMLSCAQAPTVLAFRVLAEDLVPLWCDSPAYRDDPRCPASAYRIERIFVRVCPGGPCRSPESDACVEGDLLCRTYADSPRPTVFSLIPGDITVSPRDPEGGGRVGLSVIATVRVPGAPGEAPTRERIERRFVVPFVAETSQLVEVWLTSLCIGAVCPPETTCGRRSCERIENPPTQPFTPLPPAGPSDGGPRDVDFELQTRDASPDTAPDDVLDAPVDVLDVPVNVMDASVDVLDASVDVLDASVDVLDASVDVLDASVDVLDASVNVMDASVNVMDAPVDATDAPVDACADGGCARLGSISAGGHHSCLVHGGDVYCWGRNQHGRLDGMEPFSARPVRVALPTPVERVVVGVAHTCAWSPGSAVYCWGDNRNGALGNGTVTVTAERVRVTAVTAPRDVAVGDGFTCAVDGAGQVWCWGNNRQRQCGSATPAVVTAPALVPGVTGARRVSLGTTHACALTDAGEVWCWGRNAEAQLGRANLPGDVAPRAVASLPSASAVFVGPTHSCAIAGSAVYCWGDSAGQRTGRSGTTAPQITPMVVPGITPRAGAVGVAGGAFSCVLTEAGPVRCWGAGNLGQLGLATGPSEVAPPGFPAVDDPTEFVELAAGAWHACGRTERGVRCWGANHWGQLGNEASGQPRATPARVHFAARPTRFTSVAVGGTFACALADGSVFCWGAGNLGQLGHGRLANSAMPVRVNLPAVSMATRLCAGEAHACAVHGGEIWCWGLGDNGRLGVTIAERATATPVQLPSLPSPVQSITCGAQHTCARLDDGTVHCWGANNFRQLGVTLPAGANSRVGAEAVPGLSAVTAIAARFYTTCAVRSDGSVACWGANLAGKLGTGAGGEASATPTAVAGVTGAAGIAAGSLHFCAWGTGGVQCWGDDNEAQLGQGTTAMAPRGAVVVAGVRGPVGVAGGLGHTCASVLGGVTCWGGNTFGECGDPTLAPVLAPRAVALPAGTPIDLAAGGGGVFAGLDDVPRLSCAIVDREVYCWGSNEVGELGDGAALAATPVEVRFTPR